MRHCDKSLHDDGATLTEMLVVLSILALILAVAFPNLQGQPNRLGLETAVQAVAGELRKARSQSLREARETTFHIDLASRAFWLDTDTVRKVIPTEIGLELKTAALEEGGNEQVAIRFFPDGSSTGARITMSRQSREQTIAVDWMAGAIMVISK